MQSRQYLRSDDCRVQEPDIFSRQEISRRDEISKWSTCLRMHGIPQGWARATGYKSSTPAPGVKTGRECDTWDLEWLAHKLYMCKQHTYEWKRSDTLLFSSSNIRTAPHTFTLSHTHIDCAHYIFLCVVRFLLSLILLDVLTVIRHGISWRRSWEPEGDRK